MARFSVYRERKAAFLKRALLRGAAINLQCGFVKKTHKTRENVIVVRVPRNVPLSDLRSGQESRTTYSELKAVDGIILARHMCYGMQLFLRILLVDGEWRYVCQGFIIKDLTHAVELEHSDEFDDANGEDPGSLPDYEAASDDESDATHCDHGEENHCIFGTFHAHGGATKLYSSGLCISATQALRGILFQARDRLSDKTLEALQRYKIDGDRQFGLARTPLNQFLEMVTSSESRDDLTFNAAVVSSGLMVPHFDLDEIMRADAASASVSNQFSMGRKRSVSESTDSSGDESTGSKKSKPAPTTPKGMGRRSTRNGTTIPVEPYDGFCDFVGEDDLRPLTPSPLYPDGHKLDGGALLHMELPSKSAWLEELAHAMCGGPLSHMNTTNHPDNPAYSFDELLEVDFHSALWLDDVM